MGAGCTPTSDGSPMPLSRIRASSFLVLCCSASPDHIATMQQFSRKKGAEPAAAGGGRQPAQVLWALAGGASSSGVQWSHDRPQWHCSRVL